MYKIAIAGAATLAGKELKDALSESPLAAASFVLLDEDEGLGQLDQVGDEITFVQAIEPDAFKGCDFTFFCGSAALTKLHWKTALAAGSTVLDLTGTLEDEKGVLIASPWVGSVEMNPDLLTPAVVPAHPAAIALALLMERISGRAPVHTAAATLQLPASEFGKAAMDELHQQTVNLLSFQSLPRAIFDAQAAFNMLSGFGDNSAAPLEATAARVRRHYAALGGHRLPQLALQVVQAPVFHGHTFSILIEFERPVEIAVLEEALNGERLDLILEDTDSPSNLAATGQNDVLVRLRPETGSRNPLEATRVWLWAATDNLRMQAGNAVECALELRKLRPQGKVQ
ncbi:MAG TPA: Asd/ArgC dimerization domain-containing protein [Terracidiphilus sp.]|nr:Asd/ArgC dimerization domain-containing protein [Terracidiphilus sp.]